LKSLERQLFANVLYLVNELSENIEVIFEIKFSNHFADRLLCKSSSRSVAWQFNIYKKLSYVPRKA